MRIQILLGCILSLAPMLLHAGDAGKGKAISGACVACHGAYGVSSSDEYPDIAGQKEAYLLKVLKEYQSGKRLDINMQAQVGPLTEKNLEDLAAYYAGNSTLSNYFPESKSALILIVKALNDFYRVQMSQISDTQFILQQVDKLP